MTDKEAYQNNKTQSLAILKRLQESIEKEDPRYINWNHAGSMEYIANKLKAISDFHFNEGEE